MTDPDPAQKQRENGLPDRYQQRLQERLRGAGKYYLPKDVVFKIKPLKKQNGRTPVRKLARQPSPDKYATPKEMDQERPQSLGASKKDPSLSRADPRKGENIFELIQNPPSKQDLTDEIPDSFPKSLQQEHEDEEIIQEIPQSRKSNWNTISTENVETPSFIKGNRSISLGASPQPSIFRSRTSFIPSHRSSQKRRKRAEVEETPEPLSPNPHKQKVMPVTLNEEQPSLHPSETPEIDISQSHQPTPKPRKRRKKTPSKSESDSDEPIHVNVYKTKSGQKHINEIDVVATAISDILASMYDDIDSRQRKILETFEEEIQARLLLMTDTLDQNSSLNAALKRAQKRKSNLKLQLVETKKRIAEVKARKEQVRRRHEADSLKFKEMAEIQSFAEMFEQLKESAVNEGELVGTETLAMALRQNVCGENGLAGQLKAFNGFLEKVDKLL
ncbi:hypothetical protein NEOLI_000109 [Neolecta irregularis DAH-3]|uniref:Inner kinetochore subunit AME1 domain-containing protein n=1 Tax=Neolecta irregularis (strain DAH-3) TaxID=1198029 RepID=A0A1U7LQZ9_NEOID|nr:hypothetical protein NEOLI_000109 [Neolecta irregularis DAH-3]|eukprot:OLL25003.1 hypothetical protein NEOLI_000109 [Neolecta irregularis DAH-3]